MAAHLKTGIEQVLEYIREGRDEEHITRDLEAATSLDCWTADHFDTWHTLHSYVKQEIDIVELEERLEDHLIVANNKWLGLGKPSYREDWKRAKYPHIYDKEQ